MHDIFQKVALVASIILPLFNIPLIIKIVQLKSSKEISLTWVLGVWVCIVLMTPAGIASSDIVWHTFSYINLIMFTCVMVVTLKYRNGRSK